MAKVAASPFREQGKSKDPVCGKEVQETREAPKASKDGVVHYFCGPACLAKFKANPTKYVEPER